MHPNDAQGERERQAQGIDGTAGDAQDVRHQFVRSPEGWCWLCGLASTYGKHVIRLAAQGGGTDGER